jgi:hypothetical protein
MPFDYCLTELTDHDNLQCNEYSFGGISAIGILATDHSITDFTSAAQLQDAIDNGDLKIVKKIKAELGEPAAQESENLVACGADNVLDGYDNTLTVMDGKVSSTNDQFWSQLDGATTYAILYNCSSGHAIVVEKPISWKAPFTMIPYSVKAKQMYKPTGVWTTRPGEYPQRVLAPASIFE